MMDEIIELCYGTQFIDLLYDHGLYRNYFINKNKYNPYVQVNTNNGGDIVTSAFLWDESNVDSQFWIDVNNEWITICV